MARSLEELTGRRQWCQFCIRVVDQIEDDPRKPGAMEFLKEQLARIDAQIAEITGKPPPVVVQLKTAKLISKSELGG